MASYTDEYLKFLRLLDKHKVYKRQQEPLRFTVLTGIVPGSIHLCAIIRQTGAPLRPGRLL